MFHQRTYPAIGTLAQCEDAYREAQIYNLCAGWWSPLSLLGMNWFALLSNMSAIRKVRGLASAPPAPDQPMRPQTSPDWYRDPTGAPGFRYWDGTTWR